MERAKRDLEEHRFECLSAVRVLVRLSEWDVSTSLKQLAMTDLSIN
jgi:hypothetical protein